MKLSAWAKKQGLTYQTAWNLFTAGKLPNAIQLESGTILVEEKTVKKPHTVTYSRVNSSENKSNLVNQSKRLRKFCLANGWVIDQEVLEIGSGLNDQRKKLHKVLEEGKLTRLVVEHKDRLARFGVNYIQLLCNHIGCELIIINPPSDDKQDLIQDFISIITSFCARIYGLRRRCRATEKIISDLEKKRGDLSTNGKNPDKKE